MSELIKGGWPVLAYESLKDTIATTQLWAQIAGKIRLVQTPWINHSWHVTFYVSPRGLTTGSIPWKGGNFELEFNFIKQQLTITTSNGDSAFVGLYPRSVASFYHEIFEKLNRLGIEVNIISSPNEIAPAVPFESDHAERVYDNQQMLLFWQALVKINNVFTQFRAGFTGKCSPVHFFWGAFDLAVTRFSGRQAPKYTSPVTNVPLRVMQEAYSQEVCSAGFWGGGPGYPQPAFYSYCYPAPNGFSEQPVLPNGAVFNKDMGEFLLPYAIVADSPEPESTLLSFLESTYAAAAKSGNWDRDALDFKFQTGI